MSTDTIVDLLIEATRTEDPQKLQGIADHLERLGAGQDAINSVLEKKKTCEIEQRYRKQRKSRE